jgi:hypothetical protein
VGCCTRCGAWAKLLAAPNADTSEKIITYFAKEQFMMLSCNVL